MTDRSQMPELDRGGGFLPLPPLKIGSQNTPYKLELKGLYVRTYRDLAYPTWIFWLQMWYSLYLVQW